jgi:hypothetical protein
MKLYENRFTEQIEIAPAEEILAQWRWSEAPGNPWAALVLMRR